MHWYSRLRKKFGLGRCPKGYHRGSDPDLKLSVSLRAPGCVQYSTFGSTVLKRHKTSRDYLNRPMRPGLIVMDTLPS
jgi:hypothetical protein